MPDTIENYKRQYLSGNAKKTAWAAWVSGFLLAFFWVFLILLAPLAGILKLPGVGDPIYVFFSFLCHQIPSRTFHLDGHAFAVCSRCFGVYFGLFLGFILYPVFRSIDEIEPFSRFWLFISLIPIGIDWSLGVFGIWENTHWSRFLTGMILGAACAVFIIPALVEIFQLFSIKRQVKRLSR